MQHVCLNSQQLNNKVDEVYHLRQNSECQNAQSSYNEVIGFELTRQFFCLNWPEAAISTQLVLKAA